MIQLPPRNAIPTLMLFSLLATSLLEATGPAWAGETGTSFQGWTFSNNNTTPPPDSLVNAFGTPSAAISFVPPFGTGWQDPAYQFSTPGINADGAWDLGPDGTITATVPIGPENSDPGLNYRVEFHIYVVAYEVPVALPAISLPGLSPENVIASSVVVKQETIGRYKGLTWTAQADVPGGNTVTVLLTALSAGAVVDSVEIHTRYTLLGEPQHVYSAWVEANCPGISDPAIIGFEATPDGDGISNGMKYYLGMESGPGGSVLRIQNADTESVVFRHTRNKTGTPDVTGAYEWSPDLNNWYAGGALTGGATVYFGRTVVDDTHPDYDIVEAIASVSGGQLETLFIRLTVSQNSN